MCVVFVFIIILVGFLELIGVENILGVFLVGLFVFFLVFNKNLVYKLDLFGYGFLIFIFFVMVGVKFDVWLLFSDKKVLILMFLLFIVLLIFKLVLVLILRKWYDMKIVLVLGFFLILILLFVIVVVMVGENIGVIDL